jgi:hypothetical protein
MRERGLPFPASILPKAILVQKRPATSLPTEPASGKDAPLCRLLRCPSARNFGPFRGDGTPHAWRGIRTQQYMYARTEDRPWVKYDLEKDPFEQNQPRQRGDCEEA